MKLVHQLLTMLTIFCKDNKNEIIHKINGILFIASLVTLFTIVSTFDNISAEKDVDELEQLTVNTDVIQDGKTIVLNEDVLYLNNEYNVESSDINIYKDVNTIMESTFLLFDKDINLNKGLKSSQTGIVNLLTIFKSKFAWKQINNNLSSIKNKLYPVLEHLRAPFIWVKARAPASVFNTAKHPNSNVYNNNTIIRDSNIFNRIILEKRTHVDKI